MLTGVSTRKRTVLLKNMDGSVILQTTKFIIKDGIRTLNSKRSHHRKKQSELVLVHQIDTDEHIDDLDDIESPGPPPTTPPS